MEKIVEVVAQFGLLGLLLLGVAYGLYSIWKFWSLEVIKPRVAAELEREKQELASRIALDEKETASRIALNEAMVRHAGAEESIMRQIVTTQEQLTKAITEALRR